MITPFARPPRLVLPALLLLALTGCSSSTPEAPAPTAAAPAADAPTVPVAEATDALQRALALQNRQAHSIQITSITGCTANLVCTVAWTENGVSTQAKVMFGRLGSGQKMRALIKGDA